MRKGAFNCLFIEKPQLFQCLAYPIGALLVPAGDRMKVKSLCELGEGDRLRLAAAVDELGNFIPVGDMKRGGELAVDRVLHDDVQHGAALIHNGVELLLHLVGTVAAGKGTHNGAVRLWKQVSPGSGGDLQSSGPEQGHVSHNDLPADRQLLGQGGGADGGVGQLQPPGYFHSSLLGVHKRSRSFPAG